MKSEFDKKPDTFLKYGENSTMVNYDVTEVERTIDDMTIKVYECSSVIVEGEPTYPKVIEAMIREVYSVSDELAIHRQRDTKAEEFAEYSAFADACKAKAKALFQ